MLTVQKGRIMQVELTILQCNSDIQKMLRFFFSQSTQTGKSGTEQLEIHYDSNENECGFFAAPAC